VLGTLNMADLALRAAVVAREDRALVEAAGLMLLVAFGIKAAALPLGFWLPSTYAAAPAPVAALFAIMTKVGLYAITRVGTLVYGDDTYQGMLGPLLVTVGLATLGFAALAGLAARELRSLVAWMITGSAGTVLVLVGVGTPQSLGAAMFYLPHATFAAAALMLVAGMLAAARGPALADRFETGPPPAAAALLGTLFMLGAMGEAGLPPLSGFVAKAILLDSVRGAGFTAAIWLVVLGASLAWVVALSRAGSRIFWKSRGAERAAAAGARAAEAPARDAADAATGAASVDRGAISAVVLLAAAGVAIVVLAGPLARHFAEAGAQLAAPAGYREAVLDHEPVRGPGTASPAVAAVSDRETPK
jgi:multicomponent K+:H+ antiporter subunit D